MKIILEKKKEQKIEDNKKGGTGKILCENKENRVTSLEIKEEKNRNIHKSCINHVGDVIKVDFCCDLFRIYAVG